tara:strand:- start:119 stop:670 length:552 start_codon:yes stop_codon:yes gene_type:complete
MEEKEELIQEIAESIKEVAHTKELMKRGSLSRQKPEKVAKMLYLYSIGTSQTKLVRKYGYDRATVLSTLTDYADHLGKFKELSGKVAAKNYLNMSSLEEDLIQQVRDRMETGQLEPTFRDLKELSIAKANAAREALTARGEATQITEDRKVYTQDDYDETIEAVRKRINSIKKAEIIDIDGDN